MIVIDLFIYMWVFEYLSAAGNWPPQRFAKQTIPNRPGKSKAIHAIDTTLYKLVMVDGVVYSVSKIPSVIDKIVLCGLLLEKKNSHFLRHRLQIIVYLFFLTKFTI